MTKYVFTATRMVPETIEVTIDPSQYEGVQDEYDAADAVWDYVLDKRGWSVRESDIDVDLQEVIND